jgi:molecular chaperone Hsp33
VQIPSAVGVGVLVDRDGAVRAAGGYLLQGMPGADPDVLDGLAARVEQAPRPSDLVRSGHGPVEMLALLLDDLPARVLEERAVSFRCRCTSARVRAAIVAMGREEIAALVAEGEPAEAVCEFCNTTYAVDPDELRALLESEAP